MNILFTTSAAPERSPFPTNEKRPPLGIGSLISTVRNKGHTVFFIDNYLKPSDFIRKGFLQDNSIDCIGIYANTICYRDTLRMFREIDALRQKGMWAGKIIVGGPHTAVAPETIPDYVDHIVKGEGEEALLGIINGDINERTVQVDRITDLDSLPFQPWDIFTGLPYDFSCKWMDIKPVFTMNTSRGCPFGCSFCSVGSIWGNRYVYFSAERIIREIEYLKDTYNAKGIYFREDNFTLNTARTEQFCEKVIEKDMNIFWACETRVSNLTKDLIRLMSRAGCRAFYLGVESGSQKVLDMLNKNITVRQVRDVIEWSRAYEINTYCSLITGVPGETYQDYAETKKLLRDIKPYSYGFNVFVGIPSSLLYTYVLDNNLYEYIDDIGLVYLPGYDVKTDFFYGKKSRELVEYEFKERTDYDIELLKRMKIRKIRNMIFHILKAVLPQKIIKVLNTIKYRWL